jgi:tRNA (guanine-N7-)-methyltransferase
MRQRKIKNLEERMLGHRKHFVDGAYEFRGKWNSVFGNENDLYLELGSGKGNFLIQQAEAFPDRNYIGIEGQASVVFRALQKLEQAGLSNVRFICQFVNAPEELFSECEISGIYLNFSDPWPKKRHAHRRLTYRKYLEGFYKILKTGGTLEFKTDNDDLFSFTEEEVKTEACHLFRIGAITRDLHDSNLEARSITTEYEDKFRAAGMRINYMNCKKCSCSEEK